VVSSGPCPNGECGTANSVNIRLPDGLDAEHTYRVSAEVRYVRGSVAFRAGLHRGAVAAIRNLPSPGRENSVAGTELPIFITSENRFPDQPRSEDPVWITVRVRAKAPPAVTLTHRATGQDTAVPMFDDGRHRDGPAGDGVYGVELPPFPHDTKVPYRITAVLGSETAEFPRPLDAGRTLLSEMSGYYVNDRQESSLPMVHILLDGLDGPPSFESLNKFLNCITPRPGAFAAGGDLYSDVGVRFRGHTACVEMFRKKNLKVVFNKGRLWRPTTQLLGRPTTQPGGRGLKKANFNGMWTDKALVREHLAWDFVRQIGAPYYETRYTRVHINGIHHGLFLYLEHHGDDFLDRNGLNAGGNLYLARQPSRPRPIGVERFATEEELARNWEKETNESSDFSDLLEFVNAMHADGRSAGGPSKEFWQERTFEEMTIGYQVAQVVLNNIDSLVKNHLLFHDLEADRWGYLIWDLDLTFGKFFDPQAVQHPERPVGTLNDFMLSDPGVNGDLNPWFGSTVLGNPLYNHLVNFFFQAGGGHYQRAHLVRIWDLLQEKYRNEEYNPRLDEILASLQEEEALDHARWGRYPTNVAGFPEEMDLNLEVIKSQIALHREFLLDFIRQFHPQIPAHPRMKITEVMYWPEKGDDRLEFLEILNPGDGPVDISGWTIQGIGGDVGDFVFPKDAVIPPGEHAIVARSPAAFRARYGERQFLFGPYPGKLANEGEEIRLLDAGPGHPATIDYLRYGDEAPWPEVSPGRSIELTRASLDRDNDVPEYWVASRSLGGSPGRSAAHFVRGDANGDLATNLTDGIRILQVLFQGAAQPPCFDALDANDDGDLTVSDPVYLLQHLFRSGPALPPPYPTEGSDPTPDGLDCRW
jgi:spore coat protein CotH